MIELRENMSWEKVCANHEEKMLIGKKFVLASRKMLSEKEFTLAIWLEKGVLIKKESM